LKYTGFCIGLEARYFKFEIVSGSSFIWVQSRISELDQIPQDQEVYDLYTELEEGSLQQSGRLDLNQCNLQYSYGSGRTVFYDLLMDRFHLGVISAEGQTIGAAAYRKLPPYFQKRPFQGILGVGPKKVENTLPGAKTNLLLNLKRQGQVDRAVLTMIGPNAHQGFMPTSDTSNSPPSQLHRGYLAIGTPYADYIGGQTVWCNVVNNSSAGTARTEGIWVVELDKIIVNGTVMFEKQLALIDTGTALVLTSPGNFTKVKNLLKGEITKEGGNFVFDESALTDISFEVDTGVLNFDPSDFSIGKTAKGVVSTISKSPAQIPANVWVLGGIFLDNLVTIFDFDRNRLGFANVPDGSLEGMGRM
jgi:hypothetical protein